MNNSIKTNFAAMTALQSLNMTNKALNDTQARVSTGYRVGEASDNAAYWAIATTTGIAVLISLALPLPRDAA